MPETDLDKVAESLLKNGPDKIEGSSRRIRVLLGKEYIFDTTSTKLVWEHRWYPQYYLPESALQNAKLRPGSSGEKHGFAVYDIDAGPLDIWTRDAVLVIKTGPLAGFVRLAFDAMDQWFEEDDPIYVHPMDPYKRIDIRSSSRSVRVEIEGEVVAESTWALHLFETGLPTRYYLPRTAARWDCLSQSETRSKCPYKGEARYMNIRVGPQQTQDAVWWYDTTPLGVAQIQGMLCFYNERVDIFLDGVKQDRPKTKFS